MLPDALRAAIAALAAAAFAVAQLALLRRVAAAPDVEDAPAARGRLGRGVELALALVPALLTALLLAWVLRVATSPLP